MVKNVQLGKEIVVSVTNKVGVLAEISKMLADGGINIEGVAGYAASDNTARLMLVTSDTTRSVDALKKKGYTTVKENDVIMLDLENKPGALKGVTAKLAAAKIDIRYIYATTCTGGCASRLILATNNNAQALANLK